MSISVCLGALVGCRQEMADQPAYRPLEPSAFFADGRSARPLVHGTVARGHLYDDAHLYTGKREDANEALRAAGVAAVRDPISGLFQHVAGDPYVDSFPFPVTKKVLERGRERFDIYCSMCHDRAGTGQGMIVQRGFTQPPSLQIPRLRQAKEGYLFDVITRGLGAMPDYSGQIKARDRWAIVAYVRALQLSQSATLEDVPEAERKLLTKERP